MLLFPDRQYMRNQWAHACQVIPFMTETTEPVARPARHRKHLNPLEGSLLDKILLFALPLALSSLLQQLCNSIDVAVIGKFSSSEALAAVGTNGPVIGLMVNLFIGISVGANVVIANYIGQKNVQGIRNTISTVGVLSLIFGGVLMVAGMIIARPVLVWLDTPENILDMAVLYLRIFFLGMPFMIFYNFGSAILRSIGDTRRPLYCLIVSSIVHTVMNLVLVICFDMSVAGVAIAAAISFMTSAAMVLFILMREADPYRMHLMHSRIHWPELSRILRIGVPAGVQGVVFSVANLFIQAAINRFGSDAIAGSATALNFEIYSYFVVLAFGNAAVTFIGQNYGARQMDRCRRIFWLALGLSASALGIMGCLFVWQKAFFISFFTSDLAVAAFAGERMELLLMLQFITAAIEIPGAALRGLGRSVLPTVLTVFGTCLLRLLWIYLVCPLYPSFGALLIVYPVSWIVTGVLVWGAYLLVSRQLYAEA